MSNVGSITETAGSIYKSKQNTIYENKGTNLQKRRHHLQK